MEINPAKSKVMHIGRNNPGLQYTIGGIPIDTVRTEKDIGFWITDDLSTSTHVHKARSKALGEISRIRRNFTFIDKRAFCVLYNQRVRPHLDHGMAACPPNTSAEAKILEAVQSKATALVHGLKHLNSDERRKRLGLMKLEDRRERGDLIEVYKILKGQTRIDPNLFWEVRDARGGARLVKERAANGRRQRQSFFSYRVIQKWNLLPAGLKMAPSLDSFKNRLDEMILKRN
jgi:ribonuclease P/MRP protein subunit RPP40